MAENRIVPLSDEALARVFDQVDFRKMLGLIPPDNVVGSSSSPDYGFAVEDAIERLVPGLAQFLDPHDCPQLIFAEINPVTRTPIAVKSGFARSWLAEVGATREDVEDALWGGNPVFEHDDASIAILASEFFATCAWVTIRGFRDPDLAFARVAPAAPPKLHDLFRQWSLSVDQALVIAGQSHAGSVFARLERATPDEVPGILMASLPEGFERTFRENYTLL